MNALFFRPTSSIISRAARQYTSSPASTLWKREAAAEKRLFIKKHWLSDPSVYPLMVIMGCAMTFLTGAALNAAIRYKDVTLDPKKRNSKLQTWGAEDKYHSTLEKVIAWNAYGKEGLGVDHEQWLKEKEAAARNEKA
ncbi:hypothetical protein ACHAWU_006649 [Discostella pseudostelligera]|uniref:Uncharacterized protein n=1 Tax=Discostella pseudostelligera TaxID=259834 RepID=A0ABD3M1G6_9STRA